MNLDDRLAHVILEHTWFTADDITDNGRVSFDHTPNGRQNAIGALFRRHHAAGHIGPTGEFVRSKAPHRKGGAIGVWMGTDSGRRWAESVLQPNLWDAPPRRPADYIATAREILRARREQHPQSHVAAEVPTREAGQPRPRQGD